MSLGLRPAWLEELLTAWACGDSAVVRGRMGYESVSPMFMQCGVSADSSEARALAAAIDLLLELDPDAWRAVQRAFRPWALGPPQDGHREALERASTLLAAMVDKEMGE